jgi:hypothetical protein
MIPDVAASTASTWVCTCGKVNAKSSSSCSGGC